MGGLAPDGGEGGGAEHALEQVLRFPWAHLGDI